MASSIKLIERIYLPFKTRPNGDYTPRQLSLASGYTVFCHAEIEVFLEKWAYSIVDLASNKWASNVASKALVHLCTFHQGREPLSTLPSKDIWNEVVISSIAKHRSLIKANNGIKEPNLFQLLSPLGFDVRQIDVILRSDLNAFGVIRGDHVHQSLKVQIGQVFDPFDRKSKVSNLITLLAVLDNQLLSYRSLC